MKTLLILLFILPQLYAERPEPAKDAPRLQTIDIAGNSYVSLDQIQTTYGVKKITQGAQGARILEHESATIQLTPNSHSAIINGVKFLTAHPVRQQGQQHYLSSHDLATLIDPMLRPANKPMKVFHTVIVDAGHGGEDQGAAGKESKQTLKLARMVQGQLEKHGIQVVMTREKNIFVPLQQRVKLANRQKHAIFVSLHFNGGPKQAQGLETYILSTRRPQGAQNTHPASLALAAAVHSRALLFVKPIYAINDRGIRHARFNVLTHCQHPAILIEAGFLTHPQEAQVIVRDDYQLNLAQAVTRGILAYRKTLQEE